MLLLLLMTMINYFIVKTLRVNEAATYGSKFLKTRNCVIKKAHFDRTTLFGVFKTLYRSMYFRSCSLTKLFETFFTSYSLIKIEVVIRYYGWLEINLYIFFIFWSPSMGLKMKLRASKGNMQAHHDIFEGVGR